MHMTEDFVKKNVLLGLPAICLIVGAALALYVAFFSYRPRLSTIEVTSFDIKELETVAYNMPALKKHTRTFSALRDPFLLPDMEMVAEEPLPLLRLTMIIINENRKMCKVNGKLYREGEAGPDFKVSFIGEDGVLVKRRGKEQWLFLTQNS